MESSRRKGFGIVHSVEVWGGIDEIGTKVGAGHRRLSE
jgi:hypothetical protein